MIKRIARMWMLVFGALVISFSIAFGIAKVITIAFQINPALGIAAVFLFFSLIGVIAYEFFSRM